jgi:hypothetical protein
VHGTVLNDTIFTSKESKQKAEQGNMSASPFREIRDFFLLSFPLPLSDQWTNKITKESKQLSDGVVGIPALYS